MLHLVKILLIFTISLSSWAKVHFFYVRGKVVVVRDGLKYKGVRGAVLASGDEIQVSRDSLAIVSFDNKSKLKIDANSKISISQELINETNDQGKHTAIDLIKGSMMMRFKNGGNESVVVKQKEVALGVRGTDFFFGEESGNTYAHVKSGTVDVFKEDSDYESLKAGDGIVVERGKLTKPTNYDWGKSINYQFDNKSKGTAFASNKFRQARRKEVRKRIAKLRERKRKFLKSKIMNRFKLLKSRNIKKKLQNQAKKRLKKQVQRKIRNKIKNKVTPQQFRKNLKKRMRNRLSR